MPRYHIDPASGNPRLCRVQTDGDCRFGIDEAAHRSSVEEVYALMEEVYAAHLLPRPFKLRQAPSDERRAAILSFTNPSVMSGRTSPHSDSPLDSDTALPLP